MKEEKKYRPNVAVVVLSPAYPFDCKFFIAKRNDMEDIWQFPQGGIDEGESPKNALFRELKEEIGTDEVEILAEYPEWISYDFPAKIAQKMYPYDGQNQKYFLVKLKSSAKINLNTKHPEFNAFKFISLNEVFNTINHFKKPIYVKVLKYFKEKGYI
ncbi:RNA pyrophosphohydrolase [Campylobacter peloridis]|uniref:RNA pyrophosphohydrolase n=1 Tax=Campylobacter peloridis TaxID=488546 RepID=A0ABX6TRH9_9BACT|nr:RNA pyrophosphohydrolase [Campylobacter peloridis]AJC84560.1 RNA pyrophosphohydrolase [Campylobacter peloridis LMG 23910]QOQ88630.1 RNA pyrophosphohydrolase [Campylobacter peloridis]